MIAKLFGKVIYFRLANVIRIKKFSSTPGIIRALVVVRSANFGMQNISVFWNNGSAR
jgi:hypothetical protein